tara:strand:- start:755 stop:1135 length:381 start_codon:yes stop_codon:yes gene_type:complete
MATYKIKSGDTLSQIAKKYNTTVKTLQKINNIKDPNKIRAGKSLSVGIPKPQTAGRKVNPYAGQTKKSMAAMAMKKKPMGRKRKVSTAAESSRKKPKAISPAKRNQMKMPTKSRGTKRGLMGRLFG